MISVNLLFMMLPKKNDLIIIRTGVFSIYKNKLVIDVNNQQKRDVIIAVVLNENNNIYGKQACLCYSKVDGLFYSIFNEHLYRYNLLVRLIDEKLD